MRTSKEGGIGPKRMKLGEQIVLAGLCASSLGLGACQPVSPEGVQETRSGTICSRANTNIGIKILDVQPQAGSATVATVFDRLCKSTLDYDKIAGGIPLPENDKYHGYGGLMVTMQAGDPDDSLVDPCFTGQDNHGNPDGVQAAFLPGVGTIGGVPVILSQDPFDKEMLKTALLSPGEPGYDPHIRVIGCVAWRDSDGNFHQVPGTKIDVYRNDLNSTK